MKFDVEGLLPKVGASANFVKKWLVNRLRGADRSVPAVSIFLG